MTIRIRGRSAHGAASWRGVDALTVASMLNLAFQSVIAREVPSDEADIILTGTMAGGTTANSVAGEALLGVTLRAPDREKWDFLLSRVEEITRHVAAAFRAEAEVTHDHCIGAPYNDPALTERFAAWAAETIGAEHVELTDRSFGAGDDFYHVTDAVPGALLNLGFGSREEGFQFGGHNPHVVYNEAALPVGALIGCFARFLVHFFSGITIYAIVVPTEIMGLTTGSAVLYSILYNGSYMLPNTVLAVVLCALLQRPLRKVLAKG